jgi:hypothetical protein
MMNGLVPAKVCKTITSLSTVSGIDYRYLQKTFKTADSLNFNGVDIYKLQIEETKIKKTQAWS